MKIINGKELGFMPNGTVFSVITDPSFDPNGPNGDMTINGLNIMCGHDTLFTPIESGRFNGVLHMIKDVPCTGIQVDGVDNDYWETITDTDSNDYSENDYVVVYEKEEVEKIIENLQWALNGCVTNPLDERDICIGDIFTHFMCNINTDNRRHYLYQLIGFKNEGGKEFAILIGDREIEVPIEIFLGKIDRNLFPSIEQEYIFEKVTHEPKKVID